MILTFVFFEAFMAVMFQVEVFWVVMPCSAVVGYQHFWGPCFFHLQGEDGDSTYLQNGILS